MELKPESAKALNNWLGIRTWHTPHPNDWDRWYGFIYQYHREHGDTVDEVALREHIVHQVKCNDDEALTDIIRKRISVMYRILDFLAHTGCLVS